MTENQALLIFCLEPIAMTSLAILLLRIWNYATNVKLKQEIALEDKGDGDESVANARRAETPEEQ